MNESKAIQTRELLAAIHALPKNRGATIVGIDGAGGSGKSTIARRLRDASPDITLVEGDDFYRPMPDADRRALSAVEGYEQNFDWGRLREQVLEPLRVCAPARYQRYDWPSGQLAEWHDIPANGVVVIEGVYVTRPELRAFYDLTIFVHTQRPERLRRQIARNADDAQWITRWMAAEDWYLDTIRPGALADIVLSGD